MQFEIPTRRSGFTLVELMVSVTLALIILSIFGAIYSWSTDTYATQKGIRRNDQRARMLTTVIKGDLRNRTFIDVVPFWPGQVTTAFPDLGRRKGYFGISENDPNNQTDDVLYLTVQILTDNSQRWYSGRTTFLRQNPPPMGDMRTNAQYLAQVPNQPEMDDGQVSVAGGVITGLLNNVGNSRSAEIAYSLRNGNLYRRVLLIRDPYDGSTPQPAEITTTYNTSVTPTGSGFFWRDFSYSVYYKDFGAAGNRGPKFHGQASLDNTNPPTNPDPDGIFPISLGIPPLRFGYSLGRPTAVRMLPREYVGTGPNARFFGRFLLDETAHSSFIYPGPVAAATNPHVRTLSLNSRQMIDIYDVNGAGSAGTTDHRGEDILMTNVHEFDIKVWDNALGEFVDLGHQQQTTGAVPVNGDFHQSRNFRAPNFPGANPDRFVWNRFDTWHPYSTAAAPPAGEPAGTGPLGRPPYKRSGNVALGSTNERPLLAIQITIRFFDINTKQMRQLTIQHSLKK